MAQNIFRELEKGSLPGLKRAISLFPAAVTAKNPSGATPLHVATAAGLPSFVKELLMHGSPVDVTDSGGNVPLHLAAEQGSLEIVSELLTGPGRKLMVKAKNKEGQAPLHLAVRNKHVSVVAKLIDAGARTDAKDKVGNTPLELVSPDNEDMLQLLLAATPSGIGIGSSSMGLGVASGSRASMDSPLSAYRPPPLASTPTAGGSSRGAATPMSARGGSAAPSAARTPPPAQATGTPGGGTASRLPRASLSTSGAGSVTPGGAGGTASAAGAGGGAVSSGGNPMTGPTVSSQLQRHDVAIVALQGDVLAAAERLGVMDVCASAQIECAAQVEKALETCGGHSRTLSELEERVGFAEERGRDTRGRLERLEDGERSLQDSVSRLASDQRGLNAQLRELSEQVSVVSSSGAGTQRSSAADASHLQAQHALQTDVAVLRSQVDQLSPSLLVANAASAEARALAARLDALQQQMQLQAAQQQQTHAGGGVVMEHQVLQLQAQVQLLQLPVATLTQQTAELSSRLAGFTEWQQQAQTELTRLASSAGAGGGGGSSAAVNGAELSEAVMRILDTTARTMAELKQQQDATAKQVAAMAAQQQEQPPQASPAPAVPSTPNGGTGRHSSMGGGAVTPLGSLGSMAREGAAQADVRAELESLKSLLVEVRKEAATEGGSLRREWQRAFSDMQSRYGEQANELRAREQNIAKLREAALVEEAERRAAAGLEDKFAARLGKLETTCEYLTHRLEVMEEQVSGVAAILNGGMSPSAGAAASPMRGPSFARTPGHSTAQSTPRGGPGPVSENSCGHSAFVTPASRHASTAAASLLSSLAATPLAGYSKAQPVVLAAAAEMAAMAAGGRRECAVTVAAAAAGALASGEQAAVWTARQRGTLCKGVLFADAASSSEQAASQPACGGEQGEPEQERWWQEAGATQEVTTSASAAEQVLSQRHQQQYTRPEFRSGMSMAAAHSPMQQHLGGAASPAQCCTAVTNPHPTLRPPHYYQQQPPQTVHGAVSVGTIMAAQGGSGAWPIGPGQLAATAAPSPLCGAVLPLASAAASGVGTSPMAVLSPQQRHSAHWQQHHHHQQQQQLGMSGGIAVNTGGVVDPASLTLLGPQLQLLPANAQAMLSPSVNIQRLAMAAATANQQRGTATAPLQALPPAAFMGSVGPAVCSRSDSPARDGGVCARRKQEPPICLNCAVQ